MELRRRARAIAIAMLALLYVAGIPGTALRRLWAPVPIPIAVPPVPPDVADRDGVLDVIVHITGGAALSGARVRAFAILDGVAHAAGEATSDADGRATLRALPRAEHWVVAEAPGRARASQMVVVVSGARRLDLELAEEHVLDVRVNDEHGQPLAGAEIEVRGPDPFPVGARTDADGNARVGRLGGGPYTVVARASGFDEVTKRRVPERERLVIALGKQGALVVEVAAEDGSPVSGARVLVASSALGTTRVADVSADGTVRISGLPRGSYSLRATHGTKVSAIELGVVIETSEERRVRLVLGNGATITVHVVDAALDEDVPSAKVALVEAGLSPFPIEAVTDKRGRAILGPFAPGAATLTARADGFVPKAVAVERASEVKVALSRGAILVGRITDGRGYAVDGATIHVVGTDLEGMPIDEDPSRWSFREAHFESALRGPTPLVPAGELGVVPGPVPAIPHGDRREGGPQSREEAWVSGRDGRYRATPITPGRIRAIVRHPQYVEAMSEVVLASASRETTLDVVLLRGGILEGRVFDARGRAVSGAHVTALATRGSSEHATRTGTDGSFAFAALASHVTLLVSREEDESTIAARLEVTIPEGGSKKVDVVLAEPRPPLPVKVKDARGSGIDAVQLSAVSIDANEPLRTTVFTDARGQAEIPSGRGISLRIDVRAPGKGSKVVTTTPETQELAIELAPAESVTGEVVSRRRDPLANADVSLQTDTGIKHARTTKDGIYTFTDVTPGPARITVRLMGHAPQERAVTIEDKGGRKPTEAPRIELGEEAILEGVVVDARGDPVPGARVARDNVPTYVPVGIAVSGVAVADGRGRFRLGELAEGTITIEAYAADVGRVRKEGVRVLTGRATDIGKLVLAREGSSKEPLATGGVAVTLGETASDPVLVVIVTVAEGSEAERAGLLPNDIVLEVAGTKVQNITDARARLSGPVHDDVLVRVQRGERTFPIRVAREAVRR
jgi:protocatechuate 3,4-dioxygenase beta subunit